MNDIKDKGKAYLVFEMYKANYLINNGFTPFGIRPDKLNPNKVIYLFTDSKELRECIHKMK
jgi:hypothetical protein